MHRFLLFIALTCSSLLSLGFGKPFLYANRYSNLALRAIPGAAQCTLSTDVESSCWDTLSVPDYLNDFTKDNIASEQIVAATQTNANETCINGLSWSKCFLSQLTEQQGPGRDCSTFIAAMCGPPSPNSIGDDQPNGVQIFYVAWRLYGTKILLSEEMKRTSTDICVAIRQFLFSWSQTFMLIASSSPSTIINIASTIHPAYGVSITIDNLLSVFVQRGGQNAQNAALLAFLGRYPDNQDVQADSPQDVADLVPEMENRLAGILERVSNDIPDFLYMAMGGAFSVVELPNPEALEAALMSNATAASG